MQVKRIPVTSLQANAVLYKKVPQMVLEWTYVVHPETLCTKFNELQDLFKIILSYMNLTRLELHVTAPILYLRQSLRHHFPYVHFIPCSSKSMEIKESRFQTLFPFAFVFGLMWSLLLNLLPWPHFPFIVSRTFSRHEHFIKPSIHSLDTRRLYMIV